MSEIIKKDKRSEENEEKMGENTVNLCTSGSKIDHAHC
jgi:hypothetical protein